MPDEIGAIPAFAKASYKILVCEDEGRARTVTLSWGQEGCFIVFKVDDQGGGEIRWQNGGTFQALPEGALYSMAVDMRMATDVCYSELVAGSRV